MSGKTESPQWVVKELANILGFDEETVKQSMLPDFESQNSEVKLRSQLQDFLGPTEAAKKFITRYLALRFPSLTNTSTPSSLPSKPQVHPEKPKPTKPKPKASAPTPTAQNPPVNVEEALHTAFGPGGRVYQKNRDVDDTNYHSHRATPGGSGSHTPVPGLGGPVFRHAGALTIHEVKERREGSEDRSSGKGKGRAGVKGEGEKIWDRPKSREVKRLEGIMDNLRGLQSGEGKVVRSEDDMPDCFCQARIHPLSTHTPHCPGCGLTLCSLQQPHLPCPSCYRPTLSPAALSRLLLRIQSEIDGQIAQEQIQAERVERQRLERLAAESGGGAFPTLHGPTNSSAPRSNVDTSRKTLTIAKNDKGKAKAILTTTYLRPAPMSASPSNSEQKVLQVPNDIVIRPRSPPLDTIKSEKELNKVLSWRNAEDRPWGDKKDVGWKYVEMPITEWVEHDREGRRRIAKKKKGVGMDGRVVPGAATA